MHYTLRQLQVFLAVAHFENVTRAAEYLSMSQSACSGALRDLERQYDVQLFDRIGKRLQANELGRLLRPKAEALLERAQAFEQDLMKHKEVGQLKIGATLTIGNYLAVGLITEFMQDSPEARVSLDVANTSAITRELLNFDIDLGLVEGELHHPDLEVIPWQEDELVCFCAPEHPLAQGGELSDADILNATWILREQGSGTRQTFDRAMHGLLPDLNILLELQHTEAIKRAVTANLGISCLSRISLQDAFGRGALVPLATPQRDLSRMLYLVLHKEKYRSAGIERWMRICGL
jgi:DNA-binding transcriptional LysR family regulator